MTRRGAGLTPRRRDRGQSISINYTISLVIVTLLMSGLFISMSGFLENERESVTRSELQVLGNRIAADIGTADRLATTATRNVDVRVRTKVPSRVAGSEYEVTITSSSTGSGAYDVEIELSAPDVGVSRIISTRTRLEVTTSTIDGGRYEVSSDGSTIEVHDD